MAGARDVHLQPGLVSTKTQTRCRIAPQWDLARALRAAGLDARHLDAGADDPELDVQQAGPE